MVYPRTKKIFLLVIYEIITSIYILLTPMINEIIISKQSQKLNMENKQYDLIIYDYIDIEPNDYDDVISDIGFISQSILHLEDREQIVIGKMDQEAYNLLGITLISGRLPTNDREVLVENYLASKIRDDNTIVVSEGNQEFVFCVSGIIDNYHLDVESPVIIEETECALPSIFTLGAGGKGFPIIKIKGRSIEELGELIDRIVFNEKGISIDTIVVNETKYDISLIEEFETMNNTMKMFTYVLLVISFETVIQIMLSGSINSIAISSMLGAKLNDIKRYLFSVITITILICAFVSVVLTILLQSMRDIDKRDIIHFGLYCTVKIIVVSMLLITLKVKQKDLRLAR